MCAGKTSIYTVQKFRAITATKNEYRPFYGSLPAEELLKSTHGGIMVTDRTRKCMEAYRDPPNNQIYQVIVTYIRQHKLIYSRHGARVLTTNVIISEYIDQFWLPYVLKFEYVL